MYEAFNLLVEGCTTNNDLIEFTTEGIGHLFAYLLTHFLGHYWHMKKHAHAVVLYFREHFLADNLLDDQWHTDDNLGLYFTESLGDNGRTWHSGEVEDMTTFDELEDEFKRHAIHVGHGKNTDDIISTFNLFTQYLVGKVGIAPQCAIGEHHALGKSCRSTGVVNKCQLFGIGVNIVIDMFFSEIFRILLAKHLVQMLARIGQFVCA